MMLYPVNSFKAFFSKRTGFTACICFGFFAKLKIQLTFIGNMASVDHRYRQLSGDPDSGDSFIFLMEPYPPQHLDQVI